MNKKHWLLLSIPACLFAVVVYFMYQNLGKDSSYVETALLNKPIPNFEATDLFAADAGVQKLLSQSDIQGPALINFWATWCANCFAEHDMLKTLSQKGVKLYGVNYKDEKELATNFLNKLGNPFEIVFFDSKGDVAFEFGVTGAPETFFIDEQNNIRHRLIGEITQENWQQELQAIYQSISQP